MQNRIITEFSFDGDYQIKNRMNYYNRNVIKMNKTKIKIKDQSKY